MTSGSFRFDRFRLDLADRTLTCGETAVALNARYFDALGLLVREQGRLVSKDRFLEEVWRGVPVTDEALTQCIKTLRRALGDDAARPRFIETVPKHGYRFIAPVTADDGGVPGTSLETSSRRIEFLRLGSAGTLGGAIAGVIGGLAYGGVGALSPAASGAISMLLVLAAITAVIALIGAAGVSFGIALAVFAPHRAWRIAGGALGGLVIGGLVKLLGIDAFRLLFGQSPGDITGALEGVILGGAIGLAAWAADMVRRPLTLAWAIGGIAGGAIALLGGRLMGGSLDLLAHSFAGSRLRLDAIGALLGEHGFGPLSRSVTGCLEGALFAVCIVGALRAANLSSRPSEARASR